MCSDEKKVVSQIKVLSSNWRGGDDKEGLGGGGWIACMKNLQKRVGEERHHRSTALDGHDQHQRPPLNQEKPGKKRRRRRLLALYVVVKGVNPYALWRPSYLVLNFRLLFIKEVKVSILCHDRPVEYKE